MGIITVVLGAVIGLTIISWLLGLFANIFDYGLLEFLNTGFGYLTDLFGSQFMGVFIGLFGLGGLVLFVRFVLSWIGYNAGQSANK